MQAIIFVGLQATGKSTFYKQKFFDTHVRINLDMLKTRNREMLLLQACLAGKQPFVVDNTNVTIEQRRRYIQPAKAAQFQVIGYYFEFDMTAALSRNRQRQGKAVVHPAGIFRARKELQMPTADEGFDKLYTVRIDPSNQFVVTES